MSAGNFDAVTRFVRHRPKGDTTAAATVVEAQAATPADAIAQAPATVPEGHVLTPVAPYRPGTSRVLSASPFCPQGGREPSVTPLMRRQLAPDS